MLAHTVKHATQAVLSVCGFSKRDAHQAGVLLAGCTVLVDPVGAIVIVSTEIAECNQKARDEKRNY